MIVFGKNLRSRVPAHSSSFDEKWQKQAKEIDERNDERRAKIEDHYNASARDLKPFRVGTKVRIQDHVSKRWTHVGDIVGVGRNRDYRIKLPSGRTWWRNRRFLRRFNPNIEDDENDAEKSPDESKDRDIDAENDAEDPNELPRSPNTEPRRGTRSRKPTLRFGINEIKYYVLDKRERKFKKSQR